VVRTEHMATLDLMTGYCRTQANCNNLDCFSYYSKIFLQGIYQTKNWNPLFCMDSFEGYLDVSVALNSHVTQTDTFRKDFCIANTPDSTVRRHGSEDGGCSYSKGEGVVGPVPLNFTY
jgi:hypothetical protein